MYIPVYYERIRNFTSLSIATFKIPKLKNWKKENKRMCLIYFSFFHFLQLCCFVMPQTRSFDTRNRKQRLWWLHASLFGRFVNGAQKMTWRWEVGACLHRGCGLQNVDFVQIAAIARHKFWTWYGFHELFSSILYGILYYIFLVSIAFLSNISFSTISQ